jgi:CRISPR-associated protein Csm4
LYELKFLTPLHVGKDSGSAGLESSQAFIHSDTFLSALYIESRKIQKDNHFYNAVGDCRIAVSSLLPYFGEELFLPKPIFAYKPEAASSSSEKYKLYKKLQYVPLSMFELYLDSLRGKNSFDVQKAHDLLKLVSRIETRVSVKINHENDNLPYYVGTATFAESSGLYFIAGYKTAEEQSLFEELLLQLSYSGIGGKRSSGFGKFEVVEKILLNEKADGLYKKLHMMLSGNNTNTNTYMSINVSLANDDELDSVTENGYYILVRRGGFVQSEKYSETPLKKKLIYAFGEGSCFKAPYRGYIADVSHDGAHPVYRFLKPFFLGVNL